MIVLLLASLVFATVINPLYAASTADDNAQPPDTIFVNGDIYTQSTPARVQAIAVSQGKVVAVGSNAEILKLKQQSTQVVDLGGHFVMPGFNDAHLHLASGGFSQLSVDLRGTSNLQAMQHLIGLQVNKAASGEWIQGSGWDHTLWPDKKFPTRQQLDTVSPKNPVLLTHISGHVAVANSLALQLAGVTKDTANPKGGEFERDANHELTGMLEEGSAIGLVQQYVPEASTTERRHGIELVLAEVAKNGVTSVQDNSDWEDFLVYRDLKDENKLTVRITEWLHFTSSVAELQNERSEGGTSDPWLKTGALKMVTDGALGSRTAAMLAPYSDDPSTSGIMAIEPYKLRQMAIERDRAGFQLAFHAIGDKANRVALDVFEAVAKANPKRDRRDRIEHAQVVAPEYLPRFAALNVIASMQPSHQTTDMRWAEQRVGPDRIKGAYAWATLQKSGAHLAFGTDYDVEPINPMRGLYACVTRELPEGGPAGGWQPQEKISLDDCIRAYTIGSAYAQFDESRKGTLKVGQFADFIILSNDLTKVPPSDYTKTVVLRTVVGGRTVYQSR